MIAKEEILEGGKIIARFMGLPKVDGYDNVFRINDGKPNWYSTEPKYHESWDWIMPVVTKINGMGKEFSFAIFKNYVSLTVEKGGKVYKDFAFAYSEYITADQTGLEAAFKLIVKFIKWCDENASVLICNNCKEYHLAPKDKCTCGSTTLTETHKSNITKINN